MKKEEVSIFWFRRDLRINDNCGLFHALNSNIPVLPLFIFDTTILSELPTNDPRVNFIHQSLKELNSELLKEDVSLLVKKGTPSTIWKQLLNEFNVKSVFFNRDYEPYAVKRDLEITKICKQQNVDVFNYKDQVIFETNEVLKNDGKPYTVYTPYKNKWWELYKSRNFNTYNSEDLVANFLEATFQFPSLKEIGFTQNSIQVKAINLKPIMDYELHRDVPFVDTSNISVHLRFGLISVRSLFNYAKSKNTTFCNELIWREFFMQILHHFPHVINQNFKSKYNFIPWRNNEEEFKLWCEGKTGYAIVDAGMNELNQTGYMHNRVRMIVASFLNKHLLIDWRWGEAYFAEKLLDFELSSNNGNWQWVAGTGCDSAPYFRVFNPETQQQKFDSNFEYIKKWNPNYKNKEKIVDHKYARLRYLDVVKAALV
jgi:deoxyribodipyrimidine photo-lyase